MPFTIWHWVLFNIFLLGMLALDLGVFHRKLHAVGVREALTWTGVWVGIAGLFSIGVYAFSGGQAAVEFLTGYIVEKSLSVDNIFVILMIFTYFEVPGRFQHKILFWGILGALIMRGLFIWGGIALISEYHWIIYIFGLFLIFSGIKMGLPKKEDITLDKNLVLRLLRRLIRVADNYDSSSFLTRQNGKLAATPLLAALIMVEATDLIFAVDSIPAILAISHDPFIVYTSNAFAILGLRSLYFAVASLVQLFQHLRFGLSAILVFIGAKMLLADVYKIPTPVALAIVLGILTLSFLTSILANRRGKK